MASTRYGLLRSIDSGKCRGRAARTCRPVRDSTPNDTKKIKRSPVQYTMLSSGALADPSCIDNKAVVRRDTGLVRLQQPTVVRRQQCSDRSDARQMHSYSKLCTAATLSALLLHPFCKTVLHLEERAPIRQQPLRHGPPLQVAARHNRLRRPAVLGPAVGSPVVLAAGIRPRLPGAGAVVHCRRCRCDAPCDLVACTY